MNKFRAILLALLIMLICTTNANAAVAPRGTINFGTFAAPSITKTVYSMIYNGQYTIIDELMDRFAIINTNS